MKQDEKILQECAEAIKSDPAIKQLIVGMKRHFEYSDEVSPVNIEIHQDLIRSRQNAILKSFGVERTMLGL